MISTADFRNGLTIEVDGQPYQILEFQHVKPGKGGAFVRTRLKNVKTGQVLEKTFRAGERMNLARVERRSMQFLYRSDRGFQLMDMENFDELEILEEVMGEAAEYIKEGMDLQLVQYEGEVIGVELPVTVDLAVAQTSPGVRGDTASGGSKPATLETGAVIQVPLFIQEGDVVKVDTRTGEYVERVS